MRLKLAAVLTILLCLLTACGSKEHDTLQAPMDFRTELLQAGACSFTANLTADYGETVQTFGMRCVCQTDGTASLELTAPETISGITAAVTKDGGTLTFDGAAVGFDNLADGQVTPVSAPAMLVSAWANAYIRTSGSEGTTQRTTYESGYEEEQLIFDCWFDEKNVPICAEICYNEQTVLKIEITDFSFVSGGSNEITEENMGGHFAG